MGKVRKAVGTTYAALAWAWHVVLQAYIQTAADGESL